MKRNWNTIAILLVGLAGCGPSTLSRQKAKTLIEHSDYYEPVRLALTQEEVKAALNEQYLAAYTVSSGHNIITGGPLVTVPYINVTPKGEKYFTCPCKTPQDFERSAAWGRCGISTVAAVRPKVIDITGITDAPETLGGGKLAQYKWTYDTDSLPNEIRGFFKSRIARSGNGTFRLYDDGWRLDGLNP